jgi:DNA-binding protein Fis
MDAVLRKVGAEVERRKLERAMKDAAGDKARAADLLGLGFKIFLQKLKTYGVSDS